jgi:hypothetical protein
MFELKKFFFIILYILHTFSLEATIFENISAFFLIFTILRPFELCFTPEIKGKGFEEIQVEPYSQPPELPDVMKPDTPAQEN